MEVSIRVPSGSERVAVLGSAERNLKMIREGLGVGVIAREGSVRISGSKQAVTAARRVIERLTEAASGEPLDRQRVLDLIAEESGENKKAPRGWEVAANGETNDVYHPEEWDGHLNVYSGGKALKPRTPNQEKYLEAIRTNDLVFGIGPAGTGKTYLAVAAAVHLLKTGRVRRVVLARPAVEAGEKLGFLPGDLREKVNPYLRPLFDALNDMMDYSTVARFLQSDVVEVVPLAFMRGRTLNNAVIILDEAQNTTRGQMLMFLTRMGQGSKMIVTGDVTQIDLPDPAESGLVDAARRLNRTRGVGFVQFEKEDVVRHDLVQRVIEAYGEDALSDNSARTRQRRKPVTDNPPTTPA
ncbi:MAG TPA: PhoH family protein [Phycisphaerales bacterium]|nr:PhoH family protein [Phycisphaerales bacterium]